MSLNTALAISLGVLGAVATWLFLGPLGGMLAIWAAFIAWGCYYHSGGKEAGLQSTIVCSAVGAIVAGITLTVAGMSIGLPEVMWTSICVGLGVAAMVLLANVPLFGSIPAQVYGFAKAAPLYAPVDEDHPLRPCNSYALAKVAGVSADGVGSHCLLINADAEAFTDPDGFVWESMTVPTSQFETRRESSSEEQRERSYDQP